MHYPRVPRSRSAFHRRSPLRSSRGYVPLTLLLARTVGEKAGDNVGSGTTRRRTFGCHDTTAPGRGCDGACSSKAKACSSNREARCSTALSSSCLASSSFTIGSSVPVNKQQPVRTFKPTSHMHCWWIEMTLVLDVRLFSTSRRCPMGT